MTGSETKDPTGRATHVGVAAAGFGIALSSILFQVVPAVRAEPVLMREPGQILPGFGAGVLLVLAVFALGWAIASRVGFRSNAALAAWSALLGIGNLFGVEMRLSQHPSLDLSYLVPAAAAACSGMVGAFAAYKGVAFAEHHPAVLACIRRAAQAAVPALLVVTAYGVFGWHTWNLAVVLGAALLLAALGAWLPVRAYAAALGVTTLVLLAAAVVCFMRLTPFATALRTQAATGGHGVRHVVLLTVDTLRADMLSYASPTAPPTPNIDRLVGESVAFTNAYGGSSWTLPSLSSIHTGLPVLAHGRSRGDLPMPPEFPLLAEIMQEAGYRTAAVVENGYLGLGVGLDRGFDEYAAFPRGIPLHELPGRKILRRLFPAKYPEGGTVTLTNLAVGWLNEHRDEDFFLWVHYLDPHLPYAPPPSYLPKGEPPDRIGTSFDDADPLRNGSLAPNEREMAWMRELYRAEVRHIDDNIGRLMTTLRELGVYDDALILFTSDHGEEFWEHEGFEHGHSHYNEVIHVPLAIKVPGHRQNQRYEAPISNFRLMPTALELCGLQHPSECGCVPSLAGYLDAEEAPEQANIPVVVSGVLYYQDLESIIHGDYKLIHRMLADTWELYDLRADPGETVPVEGTARETFEAMRSELEKQRATYLKVRACYQPSRQVQKPLTESQIETLKSLGYVQ